MLINQSIYSQCTPLTCNTQRNQQSLNQAVCAQIKYPLYIKYSSNQPNLVQNNSQLDIPKFYESSPLLYQRFCHSKSNIAQNQLKESIKAKQRRQQQVENLQTQLYNILNVRGDIWQTQWKDSPQNQYFISCLDQQASFTVTYNNIRKKTNSRQQQGKSENILNNSSIVQSCKYFGQVQVGIKPYQLALKDAVLSAFGLPANKKLTKVPSTSSYALRISNMSLISSQILPFCISNMQYMPFKQTQIVGLCLASRLMSCWVHRTQHAKKIWKFLNKSTELTVTEENLYLIWVDSLLQMLDALQYQSDSQLPSQLLKKVRDNSPLNKSAKKPLLRSVQKMVGDQQAQIVLPIIDQFNLKFAEAQQQQAKQNLQHGSNSQTQDNDAKNHGPSLDRNVIKTMPDICEFETAYLHGLLDCSGQGQVTHISKNKLAGTALGFSYMLFSSNLNSKKLLQQVQKGFGGYVSLCRRPKPNVKQRNTNAGSNPQYKDRYYYQLIVSKLEEVHELVKFVNQSRPTYDFYRKDYFKIFYRIVDVFVQRGQLQEDDVQTVLKLYSELSSILKVE